MNNASENDFKGLDCLVCSQMFPCFIAPVSPAGTCDSAAAMSGILKRKFEEVDGSSPCSSVRESDDDVSSSESADSSDSVNPSTSNHFTRKYPKQIARPIIVYKWHPKFLSMCSVVR